MLDSARCLEVRGYYRRFIDFVSDRGINLLLWHFTDDQGCSLRFDAVPEAASPHAYTKPEMRELVAYARSRGVRVVPELAALGHSRYLTALPAYRHLSEAGEDAHFSGMCPVSDETRRIITTLIAETCEVFDDPDLHVGFDEVNIGGHPLTRDALRTRTKGDLLADYAVFLNDTVRAQGRRTWMWADCVLKSPELLQRLPRDVVTCDWQYTPDVSPAGTQLLLDAGFDVMACSALISHDQPLFPGERFAMPNVRVMQAMTGLTGRGRVLGHVNTVWTPVRFIAESLWVGLDLAAAVLREGSTVDADLCFRTFGESFYGLDHNAAERFADVCRVLIDGSPVREDWLAISKLPATPGPRTACARAWAGRWSDARTTLATLGAGIRTNRPAFDAFCLLIDVLAHAYDAAALVEDASLPTATLDRLARRGYDVAGRVAATWDRERYADDPRKRVAPVASFQDDHLVSLLEHGATRLAELAAMSRHDAGVPIRDRNGYDRDLGTETATPAAR